MVWIYVILYCIVFFGYIFWICNKRPKHFPSGPYGLPLVGYLPFLGKYPHQTLRDLSKKYGNVFSLVLGTSHAIVLNDWKSMKEALIRNNEYFNGRPRSVLFEDFFRKSDVIFAVGPSWRERKRFTLRHLRDLGLGKSKMESIIMDEIYRIMEDLKLLDGKNVDFRTYFFFAFLNITWTIVGGKTFKEDDELRAELSYSLQELIKAATPTDSIHFLPALKYLNKKQYKNVMDCCQRMNNFFTIDVDDHISTYQKGNQRDFIDIFLEEISRREATNENNNSFDKISLVETLKDLFLGGVETNSSTLKWTLLYLSTWPEIQQKLQRELDEVVGRERMPSYQDRSLLPYVEAVQWEVYRYSSILPVSILHSTTSTVKLFDYIIPKGTTVIQNIWAVHHDPEYWDEPHVFRPERFLNDKGQFQKPEYLIPFSHGGRVCLGESLGKMNNFMFLACLFHRFTFSLVPGEVPPSLDPVYLTVVSPQRFRLTVRERWTTD